MQVITSGHMGAPGRDSVVLDTTVSPEAKEEEDKKEKRKKLQKLRQKKRNRAVRET
jgi:hypothetical protein